MTRKTQQKGVGIPADLLEKFDRLSRWLVENGFQPSENFSATMIYVLRRADRAGLLDPPTATPQAKPKK